MDAKELVVDDGREGQIVEKIHDGVINFLVVFGQTCIWRQLHSARKLKKEVSCRHSWLPRSRYTVSLNLSFMARMSPSTSTEKQPRST